MNSLAQSRPLAAPARRPLAIGAALLRAANRLALAVTVWQERRRLLALSDRAIKDIGLSRADIDAEAAKGFWDLPEGRE